MNMRVHRLATTMQAEEAYTLVEFLDQLREVLMQAYGDEITRMLAAQTAGPPQRWESMGDLLGEEEPF
ncbi:MAG: hypothetical protein ACOVO0_10505 [Burkholderiaceae bacterium]